MVDNFNIVRRWMKFDSDDEFFFIQVLIRSKDGHLTNENNTNRTIKYYTIRSLDEFNKIEPEIKTLCKEFGARAYIHYSKRSFRQVGREMIRDITDKLLSENWQGMKSSFQHCCGMCVPKKYKTYLVDIDYDSDEYRTHGDNLINLCKDYINTECENFADVDKIIDMIPTNSGCHLICKPFNVSKFKDWTPSIEVKINSPTLLYKA